MASWHETFIKSMAGDIAKTDNIDLSEFHGCSAADLQRLMEMQNVQQLPLLYQQFMLQMGKGFSSRQDDMLWTVTELLGIQRMSFNDGEKFIFMAHFTHALTFYAFHTNAPNDNPVILAWNESFDKHEMRATDDLLSEFLVGFFSPE